jgi:hypothetical protein
MSNGRSIPIAKSLIGESASSRVNNENRSDLREHKLVKVGDVEHLKVFVNEDAAEKWFKENDAASPLNTR